MPVAALGLFLAIFGGGRLIGLTAFSLGRGSTAKPALPPIVIDEDDEKDAVSNYATRYPGRITDAQGVLGFRRINPIDQVAAAHPDERS